MLDHLFTRLGSQFREGGLIHAKFVVSAGPTYTFKSSRPGAAHRRLSLVSNGGTGKIKLTLEGAARELALCGPPVYVNIADPTDITDHLRVAADAAFVESTGVLTFTCISGDGTEAATDPAVGDEIHFTLYVAK